MIGEDTPIYNFLEGKRRIIFSFASWLDDAS